MMETRRTHSLQLFLLPLVATAGCLLLAAHRSATPGWFGRYSPSYGLLLVLCALNTFLLWRSVWRPMGVTSPFPTLAARGLELALLLATASALVVAEQLFGTRAFAPSDAAALVLMAAACVQIIPRPGPDWRRIRYSPAVLLAFIVVVGALVRLHAIDFGLPYLYDPDENWFVAIAREMLADQNPNPGWFGHPGTPVVYLLAALYGGFHWIVEVLGLPAHSAELHAFFKHYHTEIFLVGRLVSVAFAVATIGLTYAVGARLFASRTVGLLAAAFMALSPLHVMYSRLIRTDIQATFLVLTVFWFTLDIVERGRSRSVLLAGLLTGVATATKYPAALIGLTAVLAICFMPGSAKRRLGMLAGYLGAAALGLFIASPYLLLDMQTAITDLTLEAPAWVVSHSDRGFLADLAWYLGHPFAFAVSAGGALFAVAGIVLCLKDRSPSRWLALSFPAVFLIFIAALPLRVRHWIMPLVPFLCTLAGYALFEALRFMRRRASLEFGVWPVFVMMAVTLPLAKADVTRSRQLQLPDTRTLAGDWIMAHIPPGRSLVVEAWTPQLPADRYRYLVVGREGRLVDPATDRARKREGRLRPFERSDFEAIFVPYGRLGQLADLTDIERVGGDYLIVTDRLYSNYIAEGNDCVPCVAAIHVYDTLIASSKRVYELGPVEGRRQGPKVSIFQLAHRD
jgi:4-amino-4-deoxy-L-arabinose transferase-like glycosyltransferase